MAHVKRDSLAPYWQHILTKCSLRHQDIAVFYLFIYLFIFLRTIERQRQNPQLEPLFLWMA